MIIATTHRNTDFDGLASVTAATLIYPGCVPVLPSQVNPNLKPFLSIHKDLFSFKTPDEIDMEAVTKLVVVDINRWERLGRLKQLQDKEGLVIDLWDHHSGEGNIKSTWSRQAEVGANITLMIERLKTEKKILTPIQATLFLAGLYEDTGNLTFPSTTAEDAYAAGWLIERKADLGILSTFLKPAYGVKQKDILFDMLQNADRQHVNGHHISITRQEISGHVESLAVVMRMFREILNVEAAFGIFNNPERKRCMVIGRGDSDSLDVGMIMRGLGGGGHPGAGSAMLKEANPQAVEEMIVEFIKSGQQSSVRVSDLMSFPVMTLPDDTSMHQAAVVLREKGCTGIPITDIGGRIVGMLSRRDFKRVKTEARLDSPVKAFMSTNVLTIEPGRSPMQAANLMVKHDVGRLPVIQDDKVVGIITRSDTMLYFYDLVPD
ncbi:MAG: CBS domain-containing protein [Desulfobacterales bacterium]|nr:CBS domain-containing protein [Desulfobacterales bacterium]